MSLQVTRDFVLRFLDNVGKRDRPPASLSSSMETADQHDELLERLVYPGASDALNLLHDMGGVDEPSVLRITGYGMTSAAICGRHGTSAWVGHPIMRFVDSGHVRRLCAGLCEAFQSGKAVALSYVRCIDPYKQTFHFVVTPSSDGFLCVLCPAYPGPVAPATGGVDHLQRVGALLLQAALCTVWLSPIKIFQRLLQCGIAFLLAYTSSDTNNSNQRRFSP